MVVSLGVPIFRVFYGKSGDVENYWNMSHLDQRT